MLEYRGRVSCRRLKLHRFREGLHYCDKLAARQNDTKAFNEARDLSIQQRDTP